MTPEHQTMSSETCPTCMRPMPIPQRGDHDYGMRLAAQPAAGEGLREAAAIVNDGIRNGRTDEEIARAVLAAQPAAGEPEEEFDRLTKLLEAAEEAGYQRGRAAAMPLTAADGRHPDHACGQVPCPHMPALQPASEEKG